MKKLKWPFELHEISVDVDISRTTIVSKIRQELGQPFSCKVEAADLDCDKRVIVHNANATREEGTSSRSLHLSV